MQAYGVYNEARRLAKRSYVIVDKAGVIRFYDIRPSNSAKFLLTTEQLLDAVKKINQGG